MKLNSNKKSPVDNSSTLTPKLYVSADSSSSCEYHRIVLPYLNLDVESLKIKVPIVWFNRSFKHGVEKVKAAKLRGAKIVMDLDDLFRLGTDHYLYESWKNFNVTESIIEGLGLADVVTVTNEELASKVRPYNCNVVVVPNALPFDEGQFTKSENFNDTRFVYVGGPSHVNDYALLDLDSDLTVAGLSVNRHKSKEIRPAVSYMNLYDGHRAALAPLIDNEFNRCKSNLKLLEAGSKGLPLFASSVHPYKNAVDSVTVLIGYNESWKGRLLKYSDQSLFDIGLETADHVRKHYHLKDANKIRRQIFESFS